MQIPHENERLVAKQRHAFLRSLFVTEVSIYDSAMLICLDENKLVVTDVHHLDHVGTVLEESHCDNYKKLLVHGKRMSDIHVYKNKRYTDSHEMHILGIQCAQNLCS